MRKDLASHLNKMLSNPRLNHSAEARIIEILLAHFEAEDRNGVLEEIGTALSQVGKKLKKIEAGAESLDRVSHALRKAWARLGRDEASGEAGLYYDLLNRLEKLAKQNRPDLPYLSTIAMKAYKEITGHAPAIISWLTVLAVISGFSLFYVLLNWILRKFEKQKIVLPRQDAGVMFTYFTSVFLIGVFNTLVYFLVNTLLPKPLEFYHLLIVVILIDVIFFANNIIRAINPNVAQAEDEQEVRYYHYYLGWNMISRVKDWLAPGQHLRLLWGEIIRRWLVLSGMPLLLFYLAYGTTNLPQIAVMLLQWGVAISSLLFMLEAVLGGFKSEALEFKQRLQEVGFNLLYTGGQFGVIWLVPQEAMLFSLLLTLVFWLLALSIEWRQEKKQKQKRQALLQAAVEESARPTEPIVLESAALNQTGNISGTITDWLEALQTYVTPSEEAGESRPAKHLQFYTPLDSEILFRGLKSGLRLRYNPISDQAALSELVAVSLNWTAPSEHSWNLALSQAPLAPGHFMVIDYSAIQMQNTETQLKVLYALLKELGQEQWALGFDALGAGARMTNFHLHGIPQSALPRLAGLPQQTEMINWPASEAVQIGRLKTDQGQPGQGAFLSAPAPEDIIPLKQHILETLHQMQPNPEVWEYLAGLDPVSLREHWSQLQQNSSRYQAITTHRYNTITWYADKKWREVIWFRKQESVEYKLPVLSDLLKLNGQPASFNVDINFIGLSGLLDVSNRVQFNYLENSQGNGLL
ncbi:MAG: hypothetical protein GY862_07490 [Gammaproteobacteria bacterium]|nr:hypothetical protein [Gammaproteobacteria bacterium]